MASRTCATCSWGLKLSSFSIMSAFLTGVLILVLRPRCPALPLLLRVGALCPRIILQRQPLALSQRLTLLSLTILGSCRFQVHRVRLGFFGSFLDISPLVS